MGKITIKQQGAGNVRIKRADDGGVILIFNPEGEQESERGRKKAAREVAKGVAVGLLAAGMVFGAARIKAAIPKPDLSVEYRYYCEKAGKIYNICPELLEAIIEQESGGDPDAVGEAGEIGLMQVCPKYHTDRAHHLKVYNLFDPEGNVLVGADYLAELFLEYGDTGTVLMAYNGVKDARARGISGKYTEYAEKVMKRTAELERLHEK